MTAVDITQFVEDLAQKSGEAITFWASVTSTQPSSASLPITANGKTGAVDNFGALASITNSSVAPCMILEGGTTYFITKSATAAAVGVDVAFKPRQM